MLSTRRIINTLIVICMALITPIIQGQELMLFKDIQVHAASFQSGKKQVKKRFEIQASALTKLYKNKSKLQFKLLIDNNIQIINIHHVEVIEPEYFIQIINNGQTSQQAIITPHTYRGKIEGMPKSLVALTTDGQMLRAIISIPNKGQYNLGMDKSQLNSSIYMLASEQDLGKLKTFSCSANDDLFYREVNQLDMRNVRTTCKKVRMSIHCDYDMYLRKNSNVQQVANYVFGLFNETGTLFLNEGIHTSISEIVIHTSEDNLPHTSSFADLSKFRSDFKSYNGDLVICLGGWRDQFNNPSLGGTAYTNALCIKSYAYAYANVWGNYDLYPNYSWDVEVFTHEIGHVLGSPHTHSCSWGPQQNEALDNCYPTQGGCAPGPQPVKGTIMSYCHLPGNPGIDFTYGFGQEPGDRIRSKVESSNCLIDYVPEKNIPITKEKIIANVECADGDLIHYYFDNNTISESDDIWLLSIDTKGQDVGHIGDPGFEVFVEMTSTDREAKEISAEYVDPTNPFYVINKYWSMTPTTQPTIPVEIQFPFTLDEFMSMKLQVPGLLMEEVQAYHIKQPGNPNPTTNHAGATDNEFEAFILSTTKAPNNWTHKLSPYNYHIATYEINSLNGGAIGAFADSPLPLEIIYFNGSQVEASNQLNWATTEEINFSDFIIERSIDGLKFEEIGQVNRLGSTNDLQLYQYLDKSPETGKNFYRLKANDHDGTFTYSSIVQIFYKPANNNLGFIISPNPISNGRMTIQQTGHSKPKNIYLQIRDISGKIALQKTINEPTKEHNVDVNKLSSGLHFIEIRTNGIIVQKRIIVR